MIKNENEFNNIVVVVQLVENLHHFIIYIYYVKFEVKRSMCQTNEKKK